MPQLGTVFKSTSTPNIKYSISKKNILYKIVQYILGDTNGQFYHYEPLCRVCEGFSSCETKAYGNHNNPE